MKRTSHEIGLDNRNEAEAQAQHEYELSVILGHLQSDQLQSMVNNVHILLTRGSNGAVAYTCNAPPLASLPFR